MSDLPKGVKPFDRSEIEKCVYCGKGIGHVGAINFFEVTLGLVI